MQGPLYLPPDPNDSYLSQIRQTVNEMTGQLTVVEAPQNDSELIIEDPENIHFVDGNGAASPESGEPEETSRGTTKQ